MKPDRTEQPESASKLIDAKIEALGDWRGEMLRGGPDRLNKISAEISGSAAGWIRILGFLLQ
jgi:hypothetical protein